MFFAQLKNELWKLFGKKRTYIGFGAILVVQTIIISLLKLTKWQDDISRLLSNNGYIPDEFISALTAAFTMMLPQVLLILPLYVTLVGGDFVAKEYEDGTLRMILSRPISRIRLLIVKWLAGVIFSIVLVLTLGIVALLFSRMLFPWKGMFVFVPGMAFNVLPPDGGLARYALAHCFLMVNASVMMSISFMFSCFNMKPAAATILALSLLFVSFVLEQIPFFDRFDDWFITRHFRCWILIFDDPIQQARVVQSELILFAVVATAVIIGCTAFHVRDIKS
jgi:ABC-2 type transport system permease protein